MPRKIKINKLPNPTHLSMPDRQLAVDVLRSLDGSIKRQRKFRQQHAWYSRGNHVWSAIDEERLIESVMRSAMNQLTGRQRGEGDLFKLERDVPDSDMEYVRQSLGLSE